jgi:hypothetical protein
MLQPIVGASIAVVPLITVKPSSPALTLIRSLTKAIPASAIVQQKNPNEKSLRLTQFALSAVASHLTPRSIAMVRPLHCPFPDHDDSEMKHSKSVLGLLPPLKSLRAVLTAMKMPIELMLPLPLLHNLPKTDSTLRRLLMARPFVTAPILEVKDSISLPLRTQSPRQKKLENH